MRNDVFVRAFADTVQSLPGSCVPWVIAEEQKKLWGGSDSQKPEVDLAHASGGGYLIQVSDREIVFFEKAQGSEAFDDRAGAGSGGDLFRRTRFILNSKGRISRTEQAGYRIEYWPGLKWLGLKNVTSYLDLMFADPSPEKAGDWARANSKKLRRETWVAIQRFMRD